MVVGGDGTLHHVINAIIKNCNEPEKILLAVIPDGTGNDWTKTHSIPSKVKDIVIMFRNGEMMLHDLGKLTVTNENDSIVKYLINIAGFGFDAEVFRRIINTNQYRYGS